MGLLGRFGPPLVLMAVIYFLSAQESLNSGLGVIDTIGRKLAHMAEFGLLCLLWWRAFDRRHLAVAALIALAYAATDEYHQTFVAGRSGSPVDWAIDATGIAVAVTVARWLRRDGARSPRSRPRAPR